jgi:predicted nicotinamide N-methyase
MKYANDETGLGERCVTTSDFQHAVLEKLGRLEAKMDMIVGNGQPGRMKLAEDRLVALEKNDLRRNVYDRIVIAGITFAVTFAASAILAWRSYLGLK